MKITFEGDFGTILKEMESLLAAETGTLRAPVQKPVDIAAVEKKLNEPWPVQKPVEKPVYTFVGTPSAPPEKPKRERTEKQKLNDEKLRAAAQAKKAAGIKPFTKAPPKDAPAPMPVPPPPATAESLGLEPAEIVTLRQRTIQDLQKAYADGHQQEVFELLSRFGNGAKSFRELPPESFVPIREAIDNGALT